jgi:bacillithiol biosynthesis deacetylase BshB1
MKLDILVFSSHPDDAELGCSGTIALHIKQGKKVGIIDLTRGELGTKGSAEIRKQEAESAASILGLTIRENLGLADGFFEADKSSIMKIVEVVRTYQPELVLANAPHDRHPDHGKGANIVSKACFLAGLLKIETSVDNIAQTSWRPKAIFHYIQDRYLTPDFIIDISEFWDIKLAAIKAYKSQFYEPDQNVTTYISNEDFLPFIESRNREMGHAIGVRYGEGFIAERKIQVKNLFDII